MKKEFRRDINGLRAWAVIAVIFYYHFSFYGFNAGFVGVDMFFVISGFLMTGIILRRLEQPVKKENSFQFLWNFYLARCYRIMPALFILCFVLLLVGGVILSGNDYHELAHQAFSAVLFISNIQFSEETGYFAPNVDEIWLLHTWSLGAEWQFYLILPVALLLAWAVKPGRKTLLWLYLLVLIASFGLSQHLMSKKPSDAFFLLAPRAWEMLVGGIIALIEQNPRIKDSLLMRCIAEWAGLLLIGLALVFLDRYSPWPGWRAVFPVLGTALVLFAANQQSIFTQPGLLQWLGSRSYSLYLWHWPIFVALNYIEQDQSVLWRIGAFVLTLILGHISYQYAENGIRNLLVRKNRFISFGWLAAGLLMLTGLGWLIMAKNGMVSRVPRAVTAMAQAMWDRNPQYNCIGSGTRPVQQCTYGGPELGVIVLGDSHAGTMVRTVEKALPSKQEHVLDWTRHGCPTILGVRSKEEPDTYCADFLTWAVKKQKEFPSNVPLIIVNRTAQYVSGKNSAHSEHEMLVPDTYISHPFPARTSEFYAEIQRGIVDTACLIAKDRPVYMVRPTPEMIVNVPKTISRAMTVGRARNISISVDEYTEREARAMQIQDAAAKKCGIKILDPIPYLCLNGRCEALQDGKPMYYDDNHMSEHGAVNLVPMFATIFKTTK